MQTSNSIPTMVARKLINVPPNTTIANISAQISAAPIIEDKP